MPYARIFAMRITITGHAEEFFRSHQLSIEFLEPDGTRKPLLSSTNGEVREPDAFIFRYQGKGPWKVPIPDGMRNLQQVRISARCPDPKTIDCVVEEGWTMRFRMAAASEDTTDLVHGLWELGPRDPGRIEKTVHLRFENSEAIALPEFAAVDSLRGLELHWCDSLRDLKDLGRIRNLERLHIAGWYPGASDLSWLGELTQLQALALRFLKAVRYLPDLRPLRALRRLRLQRLPALEKIDGNRLPSALRSLHLRGCDHLAEIGSLHVLPNLERVEVDHCPLLRPWDDRGLLAAKAASKNDAIPPDAED